MKGEKSSKRMCVCICPYCGVKHKMFLNWTGRGSPRKFCLNHQYMKQNPPVPLHAVFALRIHNVFSVEVQYAEGDSQYPEQKDS